MKRPQLNVQNFPARRQTWWRFGPPILKTFLPPCIRKKTNPPKKVPDRHRLRKLSLRGHSASRISFFDLGRELIGTDVALLDYQLHLLVLLQVAFVQNCTRLEAKSNKVDFFPLYLLHLCTGRPLSEARTSQDPCGAL